MAKLKSNNITSQYSDYLLKILPILNSIYKKNDLTINIPIYKIIPIFFFLKKHVHCQFKILSDICVVDYLQKKKRFNIIYNLLSIRFNSRICIKIFINELQPIQSISKLFLAASWWEREAWDMFGIFFLNNKDLRRILTDYGFEGHPLRKDFPLSGYLEVFYSELQKGVIYKPINLSQNYRLFEFQSPWNKY